jgi:hypothetical protein
MIYSKGKQNRALFLLMCFTSSVVFSAQQSNQADLKANPEANPLASATSFSPLRQGHPSILFGGYWGTQGKAQHIDILTLIGNDFTVTDRQSSNGLVGLGYFVDGRTLGLFNMSYGVNWYYLPNAAVAGTVVQEGLFTNLSYSYNLTHYPVYAMAKSTMNLNSEHYALTADVGIGPNFMRASDFREQSLDGGVTVPDNAFGGRETTTFTATAGIGVKKNHVYGNASLECGYRFFYLGQSHLNPKNDQIVNTLDTGTTFANALVCAFSI